MIRRIFAFFFFLLLAIVVMADAGAQSVPAACNIGSGCNKQEAYERCVAMGAYAMANPVMAGQHDPTCTDLGSSSRRWLCQVGRPDGMSPQACSLMSNPNVGWGYEWHYENCPSDSPWNAVTKKCDSPCGTKPSMLNVIFQLSSPVETACSGGCQYAVDLQGGSGQTGRVTLGGVPFYRAASMSPTGATCTVGNQPAESDGQACTQQGNLTQCVKPDGQHCATASSGKQFCWQPGENGIKASGNDAATKSPDGTTPKPPPLPPNNGGEWTQTGQSTVVTDVNGRTQASNVTGWQSNYGAQGSGASGNGASGEGSSGNGSGSGLGNGNGNGDDEGDDDGPGGPGAGVGDLYTPTDKTIASVFNAFKSRVGNAPLVSSINDFFTVNATGGCPVFNLPGSDYWEAASYDAHCSGSFLEALQAIGWVLMAAAAFFAAMWALS